MSRLGDTTFLILGSLFSAFSLLDKQTNERTEVSSTIWNRFYETVSAGVYGQNVKRANYKLVNCIDFDVI
jgi:hypothetical protein